MRSKFLKLNGRDFFHGLIVAIIISVLTAIYELIPALIRGSAFTWDNAKYIFLVALGAAISYLIKKLCQNSEGNFGSEPLKLPDV